MANRRFFHCCLILFGLTRVLMAQPYPYTLTLDGSNSAPYPNSPWTAATNYSVSCNSATISNFLFSGYSRTEIKASESIRIMPSSHAGTFLNGNPNGYFHAGGDPNILKIASFHPNRWTCEKYDRFEIGVEIPNDILYQINNFLTGGSGPIAINPYDPDKLKIECTFVN